MTARQLDEHEAQFDIHDQGRGIPEDRLENIFERFQQIDASDTRAMGGTGLGLAICRSIIDQHGGRIWASSPPGEGATFSFTLPITPKRQPALTFASIVALACCVTPQRTESAGCPILFAVPSRIGWGIVCSSKRPSLLPPRYSCVAWTPAI